MRLLLILIIASFTFGCQSDKATVTSTDTKKTEENWKSRISRTLKKRVHIKFKNNQPLKHMLKKLESTYEIIIFPDKNIDLDQIIPSLPVTNLTVEQTLDILISKILSRGNLGWTLKYGTIYIGNKDEFKEDIILVNYDVRDLVGRLKSEDDLVNVIKNTISSEWNDNDSDFSIEYRNGSIVVNNEAQVHDKIGNLLVFLRTLQKP